MSMLDGSSNEKEIRQYAIQRLSKLLRHPDDLIYKADDVRRKLAQEKLLIDAQLSTDVRRQFDDVQEGLELLYSTKEQIGRVTYEMQRVDQLCTDAQSYLTNFDRIKQISIVNRNFVRTDEFYRQFSDFHEQYNSVRGMLAEAQANFDAADFNLLRLHYSLHKLEDFRNKALGFSGVSDADVEQTLSQMFGGLDKLVEEFEMFFWHVAQNIFELALRNRSNVIVQMLKIIEAEEATDRIQEREREGIGLARRQSLVTPSVARSLASSNAMSASGVDGMKRERKIKHYKKKLLDTIHEFVSSRIAEFFKQEVQEFGGVGEVTGFVVDELTFVAEAVAPAFPSHYFIFDVYVNEYHQAVVKNTNELVEGDLEGGVILSLLRWVREYHTSMRKNLGISKEQLKPALLEGREDQLTQEYLDLVHKRVQEWMVNLMRSETVIFINRQDAPEVAEKGQYVMEGSVIMFEIINQQVDLVVESKRGKLLCDMLSECNKILQDTNRQWKELLETEKQKQIEAPESVAEGLVDYTMALANDHLRCVENCDEIKERVGTMLSQVYKDRLASELSQWEQGFMGVSEKAMSTLADIVFADLKPITSILYTHEWYSDDLLQPVIETLRDYCQDFRDHLHEFLYMRLMQDLLERFALSYIDAVAGKVKFYKKQTSERLTSELNRASKFFKEQMDPNAAADTLNIVRILISLIESTPTMLFLEFFSVKKQYPDLPLALIEDILSKRNDMDKQQLRTILDSLRQKSKGDTGSIGKQKTLFSRLKNYQPLGSVSKSSFLM